MDADRGDLLGIANDCHHQAEAALGRSLYQFFEQGLADAAALSIRRNIDGVLDREAVCRPRAVRPRVGISSQYLAQLRHKIGKIRSEERRVGIESRDVW